MKDISPGMIPSFTNAEVNKIMGKNIETTKAYPEYFLIRGMDDSLADSTRDAISLFERPLVSGMSHVSTNTYGISMTIDMQIRALLYPVADGLIPGCPDGRVQ